MKQAALLALLVSLSIWSCSSTPTMLSAELVPLDVQQQDVSNREQTGPLLRIASLNIAHGRGDRLNQLFVSSDTIGDNLDSIGTYFAKQDIHIAALQEVDSPSWWSGDIDEAREIAVTGGFRQWIQLSHAALGVANYGTAVLSTAPITNAAGVTFAPSPPTANKGFTLAEIQWQLSEHEAVTVDVVSIHMDFSRKSVRQKQLSELGDILKNRDNPLLLLGDFNSESLAQQLIRDAADNHRELHTFHTSDDNHYSYKNKRLDWIIISGELEFVDYHTEAAVLSDHRAVVATIRLASSTTGNSSGE